MFLSSAFVVKYLSVNVVAKSNVYDFVCDVIICEKKLHFI